MASKRSLGHVPNGTEYHLCEEGEHFGIFGIGFGQRLRLGKLMRLTRVGDNHGYA